MASYLRGTKNIARGANVQLNAVNNSSREIDSTCGGFEIAREQRSFRSYPIARGYVYEIFDR